MKLRAFDIDGLSCARPNKLLGRAAFASEEPRPPAVAPLALTSAKPLLCGLDLAFQWLGLMLLGPAFVKLLDGVNHVVAGICGIVPSFDLHPLSFEILIDRKKVR